MVKVGIHLLGGHSSYRKYIIIHNIDLQTINSKTLTFKLKSSRDSVFMNSSLDGPYWPSMSVGVRYWILIMFAKKFDKKSGYNFDASLLCCVLSFKSTKYVPESEKAIILWI